MLLALVLFYTIFFSLPYNKSTEKSYINRVEIKLLCSQFELFEQMIAESFLIVFTNIAYLKWLLIQNHNFFLFILEKLQSGNRRQFKFVIDLLSYIVYYKLHQIDSQTIFILNSFKQSTNHLIDGPYMYNDWKPTMENKQTKNNK